MSNAPLLVYSKILIFCVFALEAPLLAVFTLNASFGCVHFRAPKSF